MQLKQFYDKANRIVAEQSATTFGDLPSLSSDRLRCTKWIPFTPKTVSD